MKDVGEAVASVIILGIGLWITISAVASGSLFSLGSGACQEGTSGDCLLSAIPWCLGACSCNCGVSLCRVLGRAEPSDPVAATRVREVGDATLLWSGCF